MKFVILTFAVLSFSFSNHLTSTSMHEDANQMLSGVVVSAKSALVEMLGAKKYVLKSHGFQCTFPGEPTETRDDVPTEIGNIGMVTFMYQVNPQFALMVAVSDYPAELVEKSNDRELLEGGRNGALESLGITTTTDENWGEMKGYQYVEFRGTNGSYFVNYKMVLRENRLYQVAMLRDGQACTAKEVKSFIGSFKLK